MRSYSYDETLKRVNPNKFEELSKEIQKPFFEGNKINFNNIAFELFRVKRVNPKRIEFGESEIVSITEFDEIEKMGGYAYAGDEIKVLKKCMNYFNIDITNCKIGGRYYFNNIQAHFIFYMLTRDRSKTSYISKIKTKRINEIQAAEEKSFFSGFSNYLKFVNVDYDFKGIEKIFKN